jgi:hypothetical protein
VLCTSAYSLHPRLHFDINLIFVSLLVPEILAHFFCPSGKFIIEKIKDLCQDFHHMIMMQQNLLKFAQWRLGVLSPADGLLRSGLASVI